MFGKCKICGRSLKNPASLAAGIGPVCSGKASLTCGKTIDGQNQLPFTGDVVCRRTPGGGIETNVPHVWSYHSNSFEWGYGGSGPADLALNVLLKFGVDRNTAFRLHQDFKWQFIAPMPPEGGTIKGDVILSWLSNHGVNTRPIPA